jgi:hypothetical protein
MADSVVMPDPRERPRQVHGVHDHPGVHGADASSTTRLKLVR